MTRIGLAAVFAAATLAGCTQTPLGAPNDAWPAAGYAGEPLGSGLGGAVTTTSGEVSGGLLGEEIGRNLDPPDRTQALAAEYRALEYSRPGRPVIWRSRTGAIYGEVVAGAGYTVNALDCRDYRHTVYIGGRPKTAKGTACRRVDRTWRIVS